MLLNRERAFQKMAANGLDALIASSLENVVYLSDFDPQNIYPGAKTIDLYAVLPPHGVPALVAPAFFAGWAAENAHWQVDLRTYGRFPALDELASYLRDRGLAEARLGIDELRFNPVAWSRLQALLPRAQLTAATPLLREIRMVKSAEEIDRLRKSCAVTEGAIADALALAKPGVSERDLVNTFMVGVAKRGAFPGGLALAVGGRSAAVLPASSSARLEKGDLLKFDVGCIFGCYWSDVGRTAVVGEPSVKQRDLYRAVFAAEQEALSSVRPGVPVSRIHERAVAAARDHGLPHFERYHVGHSIGLDPYDSFQLTSHEEVILEENMVFCVETPYYEAGFGGLQLEDTVCVTRDGLSYLTSLPRELHVI